MTEITAEQFVKANSQKKLADVIGVTPGAVAQMRKNKRDVRVIFHDDGSLEVYERKVLGGAFFSDAEPA